MVDRHQPHYDSPAVQLAKNPIFAGVPPERLGRLVGRSTLRRYPRGARILSQGERADRIFALEQGTVRVYYAVQSGSQAEAKTFRAPAIFGEAEAFSGIAHLENVDALTPSEVLIMPVEDVLALLSEDAGASLALARDLAARLAVTIQNERSLALDPLTTRLANYLLDQAASFGPCIAGQAHLLLSQDAMARALGVSRRTISENLAAWRREGVLERRGRRYVVRDLEVLRRYGERGHLGLTYSLSERLRTVEERLAEKVAAGGRRRLPR
jgi:CRP-like cAMP-binding protein